MLIAAETIQYQLGTVEGWAYRILTRYSTVHCQTMV